MNPKKEFITILPLSRAWVHLFKFNYSTRLLDSLLQRLSLWLSKTLFQCAGSAVYEIFSLFQTETTSLFNCLYNLELVSTNFLQYYIELSLLSSSLSCTTSCRSSNCYSSSSGFDTILFFQDCCKFVNVFYCQVNQFFCKSFQICHFRINLNCFY